MFALYFIKVVSVGVLYFSEMNESKELTTSEAAARLGVKPVTVRKWLMEGLFPSARLENTPRGSVWYIPANDVDSFQKPTRGRPKGKKVEGQTK